MRVCIVEGCPTLTHHSRCPQHRAQQRSIYRGDWPRLSREAIAAHVARHGWRCMGDQYHPAHPSNDLTSDHVVPGTLDGGIEVMCRSSNSAKARRGGGG